MQVKDLFLGLGESLVGKTCGFLGLGKIGMATARRQKTNKCHQKCHKNKSKLGSQTLIFSHLIELFL